LPAGTRNAPNWPASNALIVGQFSAGAAAYDGRTQTGMDGAGGVRKSPPADRPATLAELLGDATGSPAVKYYLLRRRSPHTSPLADSAPTDGRKSLLLATKSWPEVFTADRKVLPARPEVLLVDQKILPYDHAAAPC